MQGPLGLLLAALAGVHVAQAGITVYQAPLATATLPASANYTGAAAYDNVQLTAPALPASGGPATSFQVPIQASASSVSGLSIKQDGSFFGFSVEMSVVTQVSEYPLSYVSLQALVLITAPTISVGINA
jgi:hypothetical protein